MGVGVGLGDLPGSGCELLLVLGLDGESVVVGVDVVVQGVGELVGQEGGGVVLVGWWQGQESEVAVAGVEGVDDVGGGPVGADGQGVEGVAQGADVAGGQPGQACGEPAGEALDPDRSGKWSCWRRRARERAFGTHGLT